MQLFEGCYALSNLKTIDKRDLDLDSLNEVVPGIHHLHVTVKTKFFTETKFYTARLALVSTSKTVLPSHYWTIVTRRSMERFCTLL